MDSLTRRTSTAVKLVHPGGFVEIHEKPITAAEVMRRNPRHCVTRPDVFKFPWIVIRPESVLKPGSVFFIVPYHTIHRLLQCHGSVRNQQPSWAEAAVAAYPAGEDESCNFIDQSEVAPLDQMETCSAEFTQFHCLFKENFQCAFDIVGNWKDKDVHSRYTKTKYYLGHVSNLMSPNKAYLNELLREQTFFSSHIRLKSSTRQNNNHNFVEKQYEDDKTWLEAINSNENQQSLKRKLPINPTVEGRPSNNGSFPEDLNRQSTKLRPCLKWEKNKVSKLHGRSVKFALPSELVDDGVT